MLFTVSAFIISCIVSYRALFTQRRRKAEDEEIRKRVRYAEENRTSLSPGAFWMVGRMRRFHDSVMETMRSSEIEYEDELVEPGVEDLDTRL